VIAVLIFAGGAALVALWPRGAAIVALGGLFAFGFIGIVGEYRALTESYVAPVSGATAAFYGSVAVDTAGARLAAGVEGALLFGLGCFLAPRLLANVADADLAHRAQALAHRVARLTQTRSDATEVAVAELRRIERDLHDGAQARLVAVGMSLRAAEELMRTSPEAALALVAEARATSSRALDDLRDLVRGIYPPVLADRGLGDAIKALALDCPVRTLTDIQLAGRPPAPVESAVYFAVAEALSNTAKHAEAKAILIRATHAHGMLRVQVDDDGVGGAEPARGTGLAGMERRLATFDGILAVSSPIGGPTIVAIEVPCALSSPKTSTS